ncbi:hypothetical protein [Streptomyces sp. GbtcB6]|uniref:hypothetical protein n=1 Tax=Streptomyces sp. GbtcB6 TaxID=2824751 RepID=UPI001C302D8A|nr:hypothetical protein [Streptomyces sp. GbtcB6]
MTDMARAPGNDWWIEVRATRRTEPLFFQRTFASDEEVLLDVGESGQHPGVDVDDGTADPGVLVQHDVGDGEVPADAVRADQVPGGGQSSG